MVLNVDIRITPYRISSTQLQLARRPQSQQSNRFINPNKPSLTKPKLILIPEKQQTKKLNSLFIVTNKRPLLAQPVTLGNKKEILLYQQIERDKSFSDRAELVNRFHFKT